MLQYDLAIVGSGFAGSLLAMIAQRAGQSVVIIEKGSHPRFAIGESSTPLANLLLEEIATRYRLDRLKPLTKWGSWQRHYPDLACGLKRGFTFYSHQLGAKPPAAFSRDQQLLVAASPNDEIADTHWYRADFDHFMLREAQNAGVHYFDQTTLHQIVESDDSIHLLGDTIEVEAKFVVDATGPRGFLHQALGLSEATFPNFPQTQALYTHFSGVGHFADLPYTESAEIPPYPLDDAALHHVFDGGWIWVLRFKNGITSAGVAATTEVANRLRFHEGAPAWQRLLDELPAVKAQFANAQPVRPFIHAPRGAFLSDQIAGRRWAMLPSAAASIDPLFSTGFPLTLLGVSRLAEILIHQSDTPENYARQTRQEATAAATLIAALYRNMANFPVFTSLSMLYFAAASFAETARRLDKHELASSFLLCTDPIFGPMLKRLCQHPGPPAQLIREIEPFNVAGLGNPALRNWYPVDAQDLIHAASKLQATPEQIILLLERSGFTGATASSSLPQRLEKQNA